MVGENGDELLLVLRLEEVFDSALWELGEGCVSRREDGERSGALERFDESGCFHGRNESVEAARTGGDGHNVFAVEAAIDGPAVAALRPGMQGIAKVVVGQRSLLWIWTHGLVDWLRLTLWSWTP